MLQANRWEIHNDLTDRENFDAEVLKLSRDKERGHIDEDEWKRQMQELREQVHLDLMSKAIFLVEQTILQDASLSEKKLLDVVL